MPIKLKENDIYFWSFKAPKGRDDYWALSQYAIVEDGVLKDIWKGLDAWNKSHLDLDLIDVEFLGNLDDFEKSSKSQKAYYDDKDCLDLSHSNSYEMFFIRKDAKKSEVKRQKVIRRSIIEAERKLISELNNLLRYHEALESGEFYYDHNVSKSDDCFLDQEDPKVSLEKIQSILESL